MISYLEICPEHAVLLAVHDSLMKKQGLSPACRDGAAVPADSRQSTWRSTRTWPSSGTTTHELQLEQ